MAAPEGMKTPLTQYVEGPGKRGGGAGEEAGRVLHRLQLLHADGALGPPRPHRRFHLHRAAVVHAGGGE